MRDERLEPCKLVAVARTPEEVAHKQKEQLSDNDCAELSSRCERSDKVREVVLDDTMRKKSTSQGWE